MLPQRRKNRANIVYMLYICFVLNRGIVCKTAYIITIMLQCIYQYSIQFSYFSLLGRKVLIMLRSNKHMYIYKKCKGIKVSKG